MELARRQNNQRTLIIYLTDQIEMDSNNVDYNIRGTVIPTEMIDHLNKRDGLPLIYLEPTAAIEEDLVTATNSHISCIRVHHSGPDMKGRTSTLISVDLVEKIEIEEKTNIILTPQYSSVSR